MSSTVKNDRVIPGKSLASRPPITACNNSGAVRIRDAEIRSVPENGGADVSPTPGRKYALSTGASNPSVMRVLRSCARGFLIEGAESQIPGLGRPELTNNGTGDEHRDAST